MSIDRKALALRHSPSYTCNDPTAPLSVGNGRFAYTCDITGLQTFDGRDPAAAGTVPLCAMSEWGFHSYPSAESRGSRYARLRLKHLSAGQRTVGYMSDRSGQEVLFEELRISPHRANLFQLRAGVLGSAGEFDPLAPAQVSAANQRLDLWTGLLTSTFRWDGGTVTSEVVCHPTLDSLSLRLSSADRLPALEIAFPYPSHEISGSDWSASHSADHVTRLVADQRDGRYTVLRAADDLEYACTLLLEQPATVSQSGPHAYAIQPSSATLSLTVLVCPDHPVHPAAAAAPPTFGSCAAEAEAHWQRFWTVGACVEFSGSADPRAHELERRVVLSQYLTAIQCAGTLPPPETGLTCNSWYGKFHLEMHPWHALHFPLWGRSRMLESSLGYYESIAPQARARAAEQGYRGLRWPKMTDPSGLDSPSEIGTLLCWQQPHFILMCELIYQARLGAGESVKPLLDRYAALVFESAEFMADYASFDQGDGRYHLDPPLIPAQENHPPEASRDPAFELEYWRLGLTIAAEWKRRLGQSVPARWEQVRANLALPPEDERTGGYAAHALCPDTYGDYAHDHPAMLLAFSYFSGDRIDPVVMSRTLDLVAEHWDFQSAWGWDFPTMAMCAARLGRREQAVGFLLLATEKNTYRPNGHNAQLPNKDLPLYLPGNGALLLAIAVLAGGWAGAAGRVPGFPDDGDWVVRAEGFTAVPF